jgi:hypothetical protein
MAVEYIDSPNAGFVKLGEKVGLSTITPERKRKVKRGDRSVFPITPTGAESYEDTDFRPAKGFTTPASAIPNVFDRYKDLPGGARADAEIPFTQPIFNPNPNQTEESKEEDADLEEQLRRRSLDFDPVSDYDLSRFDPSSPNYDVGATVDRITGEAYAGGDIPNLSGQLAAIANIGPKMQSDKERLESLIEKAPKGFIQNQLQKELERVNTAIKNNQDFIRGVSGAGSAPEQPTRNLIQDLLSENRRQQSQLNLLGATGSVGGAGFTTNVPKASNQEFIDALTFGGTGTGSDAILGVDTIIADPFDRNVPEFTGPDVGPAPTPAGGGTEPTDFTEFSFDFGDIDMGGLGADAPAPEFDPTGGIDPSQLNRGGKVQSFMNMKK